MKTAASILESKANQVVHRVTPEASVFDAVKIMADNHIGALVVMTGTKVVGLITERDYARKIVLLSRSSKETAVREIMTSEVLYVRPERTSHECMALMTDSQVRHLPVMDGEKLLGLISIGDLVKDIICEQQFIIEQFQHYISGDKG